MSKAQTCLISKDSGKLQIPYKDYMTLMEKVQEGRRLLQTKAAVIADLQKFLGGNRDAEAVSAVVENVKMAEAAAPVAAAAGTQTQAQEPRAQAPAPVVEKVAIEFEADEAVAEEPVPVAKAPQGNTSTPKVRTLADNLNVPPIKKDIAVHFNKLDESGRLFSVFKQYYTCLNDTCGGTVRVTMKDGFCSLWNYDEWEEFAYIDIFEGHLRVSIDPRYTSEMQSLSFCEVPRLLSSRRNLVSVQVDDLCNTMLDLLVKAFTEVGLTAN